MTIERLEPRTLLAAIESGLQVRLYRDLNMNGRRDAGENGMPGWLVDGTIDPGGGNPAIAARAKTNSKGTATFTKYTAGSNQAFISIARSRGYWCTNRITDNAAAYEATVNWSASDLGVTRIELGMSDRAILAGHVNDRFTLTDDAAGASHTNRLAGRRVYDDVNVNGRFDDASDPSAITDLDGRYHLKLKAGRHNLRVDLSSDWKSVTSKGTAQAFDLSFTKDQRSVRGPDFNATIKSPNAIDLAIGYTSEAAEGRSGAQMVALVRQLVADANRPYSNSDTNVRLNLVRVVATSYGESGDMERDLRRLRDDDDGRADDVTAAREQFRADAAILLTSSDATPGDAIGLSYEFEPRDDNRGNDSLAFAIVALQDRADDWITLSHELGHLLGANHDSAHTEGGAIEAYAHGYAYVGTDGSRYQDVMSYGNGTVLPFFSSPQFKWAGKSVGRKDVADNARIIGELAPIVAAYR